jgi:multiple sugar transport system permease protein
MRARSALPRVTTHAVLLCGAVVCATPFVWMVLTSLKTAPEAAQSPPSLLPTLWLFRNYLEAFSAAPFARYFANSFGVATAVLLGVVTTSAMAGYAFARIEFTGKRVIFGAFLATMMVPFEVTFIPNFVIISHLGLHNTYPALVLPWIANAFSIFLLRQFFLAMPEDYFDAARADGCGHWQFLVRIAAPIAKPALTTVAIFAFLGSYNALLWPLVVTNETSMRVVQVGLSYFRTEQGTQYPLLMAAATLIIIPTVIIYFVAQRQFLDAAIASGVKG